MSDGGGGRCHKCNEPGHFSRECPKKNGKNKCMPHFRCILKVSKAHEQSVDKLFVKLELVYGSPLEKMVTNL